MFEKRSNSAICMNYACHLWMQFNVIYECVMKREIIVIINNIIIIIIIQWCDVLSRKRFEILLKMELSVHWEWIFVSLPLSHKIKISRRDRHCLESAHFTVTILLSSFTILIVQYHVLSSAIRWSKSKHSETSNSFIFILPP